MTRSFLAALAGAAANVVVAAAAAANPTAYNVAPLLQSRDAFADRFWGLLQGPVAPAQPPAAAGQLYDFRQVLGQPDPFAERFYGQAVPVPPAATAPRAQLTPAPAPVTVAPTALPAPGPAPVQIVQAPAPAARAIPPGLALAAAAEPSRWYMSGAVGAATLSEATNTGAATSHQSAYDVGPALAFAIGNRRNANLAFEGEFALRTFGLSTITPAGGAPVSATGTVSNVALLANVVWNTNFGWRFNPYLLGGAGLAQHKLDAVDAPGIAATTGDDLVIAYQLGFGADLPLNQRWSLDASYRYFATLAPEFTDAGGNTFETAVASHNFLVGARYRF